MHTQPFSQVSRLHSFSTSGCGLCGWVNQGHKGCASSVWGSFTHRCFAWCSLFKACKHRNLTAGERVIVRHPGWALSLTQFVKGDMTATTNHISSFSFTYRSPHIARELLIFGRRVCGYKSACVTLEIGLLEPCLYYKFC